MQKSFRLKINNLEQAVLLFWQLQLQWADRAVATTYTVSDANFILRQIIANNRFPKVLRNQAREFQREIIDPKACVSLKQCDANKCCVILLLR